MLWAGPGLGQDGWVFACQHAAPNSDETCHPARNFAASTECHKCGAAKPSAEEAQMIEERDKAGKHSEHVDKLFRILSSIYLIACQAKDEVAKVMDGFLRMQAATCFHHVSLMLLSCPRPTCRIIAGAMTRHHGKRLILCQHERCRGAHATAHTSMTEFMVRPWHVQKILAKWTETLEEASRWLCCKPWLH